MVFTVASMIPIIVWLMRDLIKNPGQWKEGFRNKLTRLVEYHPDPVRIDPSRRKNAQEIEGEIWKEFEMQKV